MRRVAGFRRQIAGVGAGLSIACVIGAVQSGCSSGSSGSLASDSPPAAPVTSDASVDVSADSGGGGSYQRLANGLLEVKHHNETHYLRANCEEGGPSGLRCHSYVETDSTGAPLHPDGIPAGTPALSAAQLQQAYGIPANPAPNATVGLVTQAGSNTLEADMNQYRTNNGLPSCTSASGCFRIVNGSGSTSPVPYPTTDAGAPSYAGWASEITLDTQMASAACPSCKIVVVYQDTDLHTAVAKAVSLGANVVSFSGGGGEVSGESGVDSEFAALGVALFASTGDNGVDALTKGNPSYSAHGEVEYPAVLSSFTGVGGTELDPSATATFADGTPRGFVETGWDWDGWPNAADGGPGSGWGGTGWGCSQYEPKPSWQTDTACSMRTVGDVSAIAGAPGVAVAMGGQGWTFWGTSVASPLVAGIYAQTHSWGVGNAYPYQHAGSFSDVTSNTDTSGACPGSDPLYLCNAEPGYDSPTGNGSPIAYRMPGTPGLLTANPSSISVAAADGAGYSVNYASTSLTASGAWVAGNVAPSLTVTGAPAGVSCVVTRDYPPSEGPSQVTCTASVGAPLGTYKLTVEGSVSGFSPVYAYVQLTVTGCLPLTCSDIGYVCGPLDNGCGTTLECGTCPSGETCAGGSCYQCAERTCPVPEFFNLDTCKCQACPCGTIHVDGHYICNVCRP